MQPDISIVIPVFNGGKSLTATLDSIRMQSFRSWECIMVDDGSGDDSLAIAERQARDDPRFRSVTRPESRAKGASSCRNYGMAMASGKYIQFFDADDLMHPSHLSMKMEALTGTAADVAVCRLREVFSGGEKTRLNDIEMISNPSDLVQGRANWYVCGPIWRKDRISAVCFPDHISNLDDLVFNLRALRTVRKITYMQEPLIDYIRHGEGITGAYSKAETREIESTIRARSLICRELKFAGQYDSSVSRAQLLAIVHLGYLTGTSRNRRLMADYTTLVRESTLPGTTGIALKILSAFAFWALTGKGYSLVRWLKP